MAEVLSPVIAITYRDCISATVGILPGGASLLLFVQYTALVFTQQIIAILLEISFFGNSFFVWLSVGMSARRQRTHLGGAVSCKSSKARVKRFYAEKMGGQRR